jgi:hypothetical protein
MEDLRTAGNSAAAAVERRLLEIRELAAVNREPAATKAWDWCRELSAKSATNRAATDWELNELFRRGDTPDGLRGSTEGILVTTTTNPLLDNAVRLLTGMWMPWQGKRFGATGGVNRMPRTAKLPAKLLWPLYSMTDGADGVLAFDFSAYPDRGKNDPDLNVLAIDYTNTGNPRLVIRDIRDELVQLVPGAYLGKILYRLPGDRFMKIGYFALRSPG